MWVDLRISDLDGDCGQSPSDVSNPVVTARRDEGLCDRFGQRRGCHVDRVHGVVQIVDDDGTGFKKHQRNLIYSLFVRLLELDLRRTDEV